MTYRQAQVTDLLQLAKWELAYALEGQEIHNDTDLTLERAFQYISTELLKPGTQAIIWNENEGFQLFYKVHPRWYCNEIAVLDHSYAEPWARTLKHQLARNREFQTLPQFLGVKTISTLWAPQSEADRAEPYMQRTGWKKSGTYFEYGESQCQ